MVKHHTVDFGAMLLGDLLLGWHVKKHMYSFLTVYKIVNVYCRERVE